MFNLEKEKIFVHLATRILVFGRARKPKMFVFIFDVGARGIYLSLTLGTAKFKELD